MTSFRYLVAVMFPWMVTFWVFVRVKTLERVLLYLFSPFLMFFIKDNQQGILSYQIWQLPCRARGARAHNLFSHLTFSMNSFVHGNVFFFPLIHRLVHTKQSNQNLDALIKLLLTRFLSSFLNSPKRSSNPHPRYFQLSLLIPCTYAM